MKRFNVFIIILIFLFILPTVLVGGPSNWDQDDDDDDKKYRWKRWRHHDDKFYDGFGAFTIDYQVFDGDALNQLAEDAGLGDLDDGIITFGGYGMGYVGKGWYIGGGGFGGRNKTSGVYTDDTDPNNVQRYNRRLDIHFGGGGFQFEWAPLIIGPVNFGAGALLGGGGASIKVTQHTGTLSWGDLTDPFRGIDNPNAQPGDNNVVKAERGFWLARPYITGRVRLLDWFSLSGTVGYNLTSLSTSGWKFENQELEGKGPDLDLDEPFYRFGLIFGG